jgi:hypothetical protein
MEPSGPFHATSINTGAKGNTIPTGKQLARSPQKQKPAYNPSTHTELPPKTPRRHEQDTRRPKTPGAYPESPKEQRLGAEKAISTSETLPTPPWVRAEKEGTLGVKELPSNHSAHYSKTQYEADCELIVHFAHNRELYDKLPFWKHINSKEIYWSARGVLLTAPESKVQGFAKRNQPYRHGGASFDWFINEPSFIAWLKRFRAGPTNRRSDTSPPSEVDNRGSGWSPLARRQEQIEVREDSESPSPRQRDMGRIARGSVRQRSRTDHVAAPPRPKGKQPLRPNPNASFGEDWDDAGPSDNNPWARHGQENQPFGGGDHNRQPGIAWGVNASTAHLPREERESSDERRERELAQQAKFFEEAMAKKDEKMTILMQELEKLKARQDEAYHHRPYTQDARYQGPSYQDRYTSRGLHRYQDERENFRDYDQSRAEYRPRPDPYAGVSREHHSAGAQEPYQYRGDRRYDTRERIHPTVEHDFPPANRHYDQREPQARSDRFGRFGPPIPPQSRSGFPYEPEERRPSQAMTASSRSRLRASDVLLWDPKELSPVFFADRIRQVAQTQGEEEVLAVLPLCLKGDAIGWHNGLSSGIKAIMNSSIDEWERQLLLEFLPNQSEANASAKRLKFKFENASDLPLTSYLRQKQQALRDAGYRDEAAIKLAMWETLDIELKGITPLRSAESLPEFVARVRENESAAYASWQVNRRPPRISNSSNKSNYNYREPRNYDRYSERANIGYRTEERRRTARDGLPAKDRYTPAPDRMDTNRTDRGGTGQAQPDKKEARPIKQREPRRPCRHCRGAHWDNECPTRPKAYQVDDEEESTTEQGDEDDVAMADLQSSDSDSEPENY